MRYLISTDLDGTLLDHHSYEWQAAQPAIDLCKQEKIPIVFNTSKTLEEARELQSQIGIQGPAIVENGSALILPKTFMDMNLDFDYLNSIEIESQILSESDRNGIQILFGEQRSKLLEFIEQVRRSPAWQFEGFNDWSSEQIAENTGLSLRAAKSASVKKYSEPFVWGDSEEGLQRFIELAAQNNYKVLRGGRFYHLQGNTNKALPILWLQRHILPLYGANNYVKPKHASKYAPELICLGDNKNDIDMLNVADYPVCVRSPVADFPKLQTGRRVIYTDGEGPIGWNQTINTLVKA